MKQALQTFLFILILTCYACGGHHKQSILLLGYDNRNEIVYDTRLAKFMFSKSAIINYCNSKDTSDHNNLIYTEVLDYLNDHPSNCVIISDTVGSQLVPDSTINHGKSTGKLVRVRDQKSEYAFVNEALGWTLLDLIKKGELKVYDKQTSKFVDHVILDSVNTNYYGEKCIYLPNDTLIFNRLIWIR